VQGLQDKIIEQTLGSPVELLGDTGELPGGGESDSEARIMAEVQKFAALNAQMEQLMQLEQYASFHLMIPCAAETELAPKQRGSGWLAGVEGPLRRL
jgi:hypothetical protein